MMKMKKRISYAFVLLLAILLCACAVSPDPFCRKDGQVYCRLSEQFTGEWYSYYKRGISCMEGECYEAAVSELAEATRRRYEEKKFANTYGMHFIRYFPHRETGIAHYFLGDYDAAESELELSIAQEPSSKAYFYLNNVRKRKMQQEGLIPGKPDLKIAYPQGEPDERRTRDDPVVISGTAQDEQYVSEILLAGRPVFMDVSQKHKAFTKELSLDHGSHPVDIIARNLLGGETRRTIIIHVDRAGPMIFTERTGKYKTEGSVSDESGIRSLVLKTDGEQEAILVGEDRRFVLFLEPGTIRAALFATDQLGNETRAELITDMATKNLSLLLLAQNSPTSVTDAGPVLISDSDTPDIMLKGWPDQTTVFKKNVDLEGEVKGRNKIEELTIQVNNRNWNLQIPKSQASNIRHQTSGIKHQASFNRLLNLNEGENRVIIRIKNASGRTGMKEILIIREIPIAFRPEHRYSLKMCLFDTTSWKKEMSQGFFRRMVSKIPILWNPSRFMEQERLARFQHFLAERLGDRNRFQIREQDELKMIFQDLQIRQGSFETAKQPCHALILGDTCETRKGTEIFARFVDPDTGEILTVEDVYDESQDRSALVSMSDRLSEKFHRKFPLAYGPVINITEKKLSADIEAGKIMEGWPMMVYREENPQYNPVTGKPLGSETKIITDASMGSDHLLIIKDTNRIKTGDKVIAR